MAVALINGRNFVHKDIAFNWGGVPVYSLSNLEITSTKQRDFSYGTSDLPVGYGDGRNEPVSVSFEISMTDFVAINRAAGSSGVKSLPPQDIPITFSNPSNPAAVIIKNMMVTEDSFSSDPDTMDIKVPITGIASHLEWK